MAVKGLSLNIGVNRVDPSHYLGWTGSLAAAEKDAVNLSKLGEQAGFLPQRLLGSEATAFDVLSALQNAAEQLQRGDIVLISFAGYGGQVPDDDAPSGRANTWLLHDRQLVDDELWAGLAKFKSGVRIIMLLDTGYSATVCRAIPLFESTQKETALTTMRLMPAIAANRVYRDHKKLYDTIQEQTPSMAKTRLRASLISIQGCQDNQIALEGASGGLFTETLLKVWNRGRFTGNYGQFRNRIVQKMPPHQTPNYIAAGSRNKVFESQQPFSI